MGYEVTVDITPVPKGRPRIMHGKAVTPYETRKFENDLGALIRCEVWKAGIGLPVYPDQRLSVEVETGPSRGDIDNLAKSILDSCNGILWSDDRQVDKLEITVHRKQVKPMVRIAVNPR